MCPEPDHMYKYMSLSVSFLMRAPSQITCVSVGLVVCVFSHLSLLLLRTPLT